jgi:serine/tyrosine/threonine adenylyltransferase
MREFSADERPLGAAGPGLTGFRFDNSYARLPDVFFKRLDPTPVSKPQLIRLNVDLCRILRLDPDRLAGAEGVEILAGNRVPEGAEPLAMAYAGHQFGSFVPRLGDGRALLLGEIEGLDGVRYDVQLKGAGPTPFSRMGDGRAAIGPVLREYIVSEAMAAFAIPTTRALAAVTTGERIIRQGWQLGAVLCRVAKSHVRVGTFEFFAAQDNSEALHRLADYVIDRHYPDALATPHPYRTLLAAVIDRTAKLVARWQLIGFIHGVMNTDNTSIAGETIDYGPCAFMDFYHPATVYSSIDVGGRYAFANQPRIAQWNLARLAQSLLPVLGDTLEAAIQVAQQAIDEFPARFETAYVAGLRQKLGLEQAEAGDRALAQELLDCMAQNTADFTLTFRRLADCASAGPDADGPLRSLFEDPTAFDRWVVKWRHRLECESRSEPARQAAMRAVNPAFIPRNHLVEAALAAAQSGVDFAPFNELLQVLSRPYDDQPQFSHYGEPPRPDQVVLETFCGT